MKFDEIPSILQAFSWVLLVLHGLFDALRCSWMVSQVVLAIGELLEERENGKTDEVNERMLNPVIKKLKPEDFRSKIDGFQWDFGRKT